MKYIYKSNPDVHREILKVCFETLEKVKASSPYARWYRNFENKFWEPLAEEVLFSDEDMKNILAAFHKTKGIIATLPCSSNDCIVFKNNHPVIECSREMLLMNICRTW